MTDRTNSVVAAEELLKRYAAFLRARQRETSPMMWAALYQQRPAPEEGDYFKADWLIPAGKHDDQVDALGLVGQLLDQMVPGRKPKEPEKPKSDSGYRPLSLTEKPLDWMLF